MKTNFYHHFRLHCLSFISIVILLASHQGVDAQTPDSVFFRDDFEENTIGTTWQADPSWSIENGSAYNFIDGINGTLKTTEAFSAQSYIIETSARGFTGGYYREFRITFGQADLATENLYQVRYTAYGGPRLSLSRASGNIYGAEILDEVPLLPELNAIQWYTFKIAKYKSGLIQVFLNQGLGYPGIPVLEAIDTTYSTLNHTGWHVGSETSPEVFYIDWFSVSKPGVEKPAIKEKPVEDNLIKQVTVKSSKPYTVAKLFPGVKQFTDREYTITALPDYLKGASFIQTANEDKSNAADSFLTFFLQEDAIVYIGYDPRGTVIPEWLTNWTATGDSIRTSDEKAGYLNIYSRIIRAEERYYPVILGGNLAAPAMGAITNYLVAAIKLPPSQKLQAEDALLSGAVVANNHLNYNGTGFADFKNPANDFIEWTVPVDVPGTYNIGFTFAHAGFSDRSLQLSDNGIYVATVVFNPVSTSWSGWAFLSGPNLFLTPGVHKIRLTATGTSGPNIDELNISYQTSSLPLARVSTKNYVSNRVTAFKPHEIYKAYPNPFLQSTDIYYSLKEKANVHLAIYSLNGQQVQVLQNGSREAGSYKAGFNAGKLASGIYLYRLKIGNEVTTGKLIKQ